MIPNVVLTQGAVRSLALFPPQNQARGLDLVSLILVVFRLRSRLSEYNCIIRQTNTIRNIVGGPNGYVIPTLQYAEVCIFDLSLKKVQQPTDSVFLQSGVPYSAHCLPFIFDVRVLTP
jgi:hypothetical protein